MRFEKANVSISLMNDIFIKMFTSLLGTDEAMDEDELMVQWFELVNAKNDLVRKEADLMYQQRQQELEVLHEELEYDLRCLMNKPGEVGYIIQRLQL